MQIQSSLRPLHKSTAVPQTDTAPVEAAPEAEPQDGFSITRTLAGGLLGFMGRRLPTTYPKNSPEKCTELKLKIKPGDVLMSSDLDYPGWSRMEYFTLGSRYIHAAMVGSDGQVYEAVGEGVIKTDVDHFLEGHKKIAVARFDLDEEEVQKATDYARSHLGKSYDSVFNFADEKELYCSELVTKALAASGKVTDVPRAHFLGKEAVAPDAFLKMPQATIIHDDKCNYWTNKLTQWPLAASSVALGAAGYLLGGGVGGALAGAATGFVGSVLIGNKIQTGHYSPMIEELRKK
jgi:Permuted papain-like amidase enzyme, YaeF/YiiX, C92 family